MGELVAVAGGGHLAVEVWLIDGMGCFESFEVVECTVNAEDAETQFGDSVVGEVGSPGVDQEVHVLGVLAHLVAE